MIKKIDVKQLKPGMFIHDMNCGWLQHPFLKNRMIVKDGAIVEKINEYGIREVYIDTLKGTDTDRGRGHQVIDRDIGNDLHNIAASKSTSVRSEPIEREIIRAREIKREAKHAVHSIMEEVRFGRPIRTETAGKVVDKMIDSIFRNQDALIALGRIKHADEYTYMHSLSVCILMISFGKHLGFDPQQLREVGIGAMLHDIGKMQVPENILNCKGTLSEQEYDLMKKHVEFSHLLLEQTEGIAELSVVVASQHHERIDGKGYPNRLKGDDISIYGQVAAIADVYDAMTSNRCYQPTYEPTEVLRKLYEWNNSYNNDLVQQFILCVGIYPTGSLVRLDNGLLGIVLDHGRESLLHPSVRIIYDTIKERHIIPPYDIDLARGGKDFVSGYELPARWNIKPEIYL